MEESVKYSVHNHKIVRKNRAFLGILRQCYAGIRYQRGSRNTEPRSSWESGNRYVLKGFGFGLDNRPIKFVSSLIQGFVCCTCQEVPAIQKVFLCFHIMCESCLDVAIKSSGLVDDDSAASYIACPKCGVHFTEQLVRTRLVPSELVESLHAYCFNAEYGCTYHGLLENIRKHSELCCRYHPRNLSKGFIPVKAISTDRHFSHQNESSSECAYARGDYDNQGHGVRGAAGCVPRSAAGRPAVAACPFGRISNSVEELVELLATLKPPSSAEAKCAIERQDLRYGDNTSSGILL